MVRLRIYISMLIIPFLGFHCSENQKSPSATNFSHTKDQKSSTDFSSTQEVPITYAKNFSIEERQGFKIAHVHFKSANRNMLFDQKIIFIKNGQTPPPLQGDLSEAWIVNVPLQSVAANDDGEITRLTTLNLSDNIIAMGGGGIYDTLLRKRWEEGTIASIGYSFHRMPLPEMLMALNPDVLFLYAYDQNRLKGMEKLRKLGINAIPQFAWAEPSFLGKAEWIKFTSLFFDKEREAQEIFDQIKNRCDELMAMVATIAPKKKAFLVYHPSDISDWSGHRNDFYASFIEAAGAENLLKDDGPNHPVGLNNEQLLVMAKDADVWIANSTSDLDWPPANYLESFNAYRNQEVYHYQKRTRYEHNAYDWYETPEVRPDLVLEDLISMFYPDLLPNHELLFFEKIEQTKFMLSSADKDKL